MKLFGRLLFVFCTFACIVGVTRAAATHPSVTASGLGPFTIGMSLDEVNRHLRKKIVPHEVPIRATPNCDYNEIPELPGIAFVFIDNKLMRIDVQATGWKYDGAVSVGMKKDAFLRQVKHAVPEPLDHVPEGVSYVVNAANSGNAVSFQFEAEELSRMILGDKKVIRYAEACM